MKFIPHAKFLEIKSELNPELYRVKLALEQPYQPKHKKMKNKLNPTNFMEIIRAYRAKHFYIKYKMNSNQDFFVSRIAKN